MAPEIRLRTCEPTEVDGRVVYRWRTDPLTQEMFFTRLTASWEKFFPVWRDGYFSDATLPPVFALDPTGRPAAILSFQRVPPKEGFDKCAEISINVAPEARGKGLATKALEMVGDYLEGCDLQAVFAVVKKSNPASCAAFQRAGFSFVDDYEHTDEHTNERIPVNCYCLRLGTV